MNPWIDCFPVVAINQFNLMLGSTNNAFVPEKLLSYKLFFFTQEKLLNGFFNIQ